MATKKYFTDESLSALIDQIKAGDAESLSSAKSYTNTEVAKITGGTTVVPEAEHAESADTANSVAWANVTGKPNTYTPSSHNHAISEVIDLQSTIDTINSEIDGSIKSLSISGKTITYTKNDGTTGTVTTQDTNTDTKVTNTLETTTKAYVTGTTSSTTSTGTQIFDTGVYLDTIAGQLVATTFKGNLSGNATTATSATSATSSTKATQDASGNVITSTYETKTDASSKLAEAKTYADNAAATVKNDLLNGAGTAYDTLKELGDLIADNADAIEALETIASGKANVNHTHTIADVSGLQSALNAKDTAIDELSEAIEEVKTMASNQDIVVLAEAQSSAMAYTDSVVATKADVNHSHTISDVTNLQSSLDAKQATITGGASTITSSNLTASRALISNSSGKVAVSAVTSTELGYLDGVTSAIQTQLDGKAASSHTHNYAGSSSAGGAATSANKVNSSLTVKLNSGTTEGTNMFTFNGSAAKSIDITPSAIGAAASSHTHDDRYYTETEVDTKLSGKANSSHTHSDATTSAAGFMTAAMVTKLNGIATGATKITVDSALSSSSTNPVQNKAVNSAISTLTSVVSTNTSSIESHTTAISALQTSISEIQEITSAEIQNLFSA